jgi:hypothetical protein
MTPVVSALLTLLENVFVAEEPEIQAVIILELDALLQKFKATPGMIPNLPQGNIPTLP